LKKPTSKASQTLIVDAIIIEGDLHIGDEPIAKAEILPPDF
jgi:hypothetical protein